MATNITWESLVATKTINDGGYIGDLMAIARAHIQDAIVKNEITQEQAGAVYTAMIPEAFKAGVQFLLQEQTVEAQVDNVIKDGALKDEQLRALERKYFEDDARWGISAVVLENQKLMSDVDVSYKERMSEKALAQVALTLDSMQTDIDFNTSKKTVMEYTRKDNIRMKATEQFAEFLKYISAADVVPAEEDFKNIRKLVTSIVTGLTDPDAGVTLVDPTTSFQTK